MNRFRALTRLQQTIRISTSVTMMRFANYFDQMVIADNMEDLSGMFGTLETLFSECLIRLTSKKSTLLKTA